MRELVAVSSPDVLGALGAALDGTGPALLPIAPGETAPASLTGPVKEEIALAVATSGSTGEPKGVLLSAAALRASAEATHARLGGPGTWLLALSPHHIAGVQVLIRSLLAGSEPGVLTGQGFRPSAFADAARAVLDRPGRHYTSLVPTQLVRLLADGGAGLEALAAFDGVLLGGAATPAELLSQARAAGVAAVTTYGMSETCGGCVYDGVPLDGVRVRLDQDGRISLSGPVLASGYRGASASAFAEGWFHTNDLGQFEPDGRLTVLGRADDMIISGGVNVAPALVERVLCAEPDVLEACVLGLPHPEWGQLVAAAVVPADQAVPPSPSRLRALVSAQLGGAFAPKRIELVPELPLRGPGKVDRRALAAMMINMKDSGIISR
ncbi:o-succinylbenzoate--CoA ligase [Allokutzneria sp. NRRL B-24872]|uniref:o-succinylbenzoate--CoA ligase n=1 Tax=Allokutzneria sp. NRRL B-24872 TaxID=1137961 RepID=UPI000A360878|nr:o-succinylbenzoate--CoA ligase [Allokutzneria sp. NRRL B-24872]